MTAAMVDHAGRAPRPPRPPARRPRPTRRARTCRATTSSWRTRAAAIDKLNGAGRESPRRAIPAAPPPAPVQPGGRRVDGPRAEARQAARSGRARAEWRPARVCCPSPDAALLRGVAFVITLDADSRLAPGAARRMIETIAHPLNRARRGARRDPASAGYGVIQPRIAAFGSASRPPATRLGRRRPRPGPMPPRWTHLPQQRLGEASFFGKGMHDVRAFAADRRPVRRQRHPQPRPPRGLLRAHRGDPDACVLEESPADYAGEASGATAGCAATGRTSSGCCAARAASPSCRAGRWSRTCAATSCRPAW